MGPLLRERRSPSLLSFRKGRRLISGLWSTMRMVKLVGLFLCSSAIFLFPLTPPPSSLTMFHPVKHNKVTVIVHIVENEAEALPDVSFLSTACFRFPPPLSRAPFINTSLLVAVKQGCGQELASQCEPKIRGNPGIAFPESLDHSPRVIPEADGGGADPPGVK